MPQVLRGHSGPVRTLAACGGLMFSGSYDKAVRAWDVATLELKATCTGHSGAVRALVASDRRVFSGSDDATVKVRAQGAGRGVARGSARAGGEGGGGLSMRARAWLGRAACVRALHAAKGRGCAPCACSRPHAPAPWPTLQVWDAESLTCVKTLVGHDDNVRVLAVGERYMFSGSWDKSIRVGVA